MQLQSDGMPRHINPEWERAFTKSKVGYCDGKKIAGLNCGLYATLKPVYFAGRTMYLCGRCIQRLNQKRLGKTKPIPRY